jgi:IS30 family transposase
VATADEREHERAAASVLPKGTDLSRWSAEDLEAVALALNNRPRKVLGWKAPAEVFSEQLQLLQQPGVASTD